MSKAKSLAPSVPGDTETIVFVSTKTIETVINLYGHFRPENILAVGKSQGRYQVAVATCVDPDDDPDPWSLFFADGQDRVDYVHRAGDHLEDAYVVKAGFDPDDSKLFDSLMRALEYFYDLTHDDVMTQMILEVGIDGGGTLMRRTEPVARWNTISAIMLGQAIAQGFFDVHVE